MTTQNKGCYVFNADTKFICQEITETGRVQNPRHTDDFTVFKPCGTLHHFDHHIKWIGDDNHESLRRIFFDILTDAIDDTRINANQIITAHPRFTGYACGDNHNISADVFGRAKKPFSVWRKMEQKQLSFSRLSDIYGFRVITGTDATVTADASAILLALWGRDGGPLDVRGDLELSRAWCAVAP